MKEHFFTTQIYNKMDIAATIMQINELCTISVANLMTIYLTLKGVKRASMITPVVSNEFTLTTLLPEFHRILKPYNIYVEQTGCILWIINAIKYVLYIQMTNHIDATKHEICKGELLSYFTPMNIFDPPTTKTCLFCRIKCTIETDAKELVTFGLMGQKISNKTIVECDKYYNQFIDVLLDFNTLHLPFKLIAMETVYSTSIADAHPIVKYVVID